MERQGAGGEDREVLAREYQGLGHDKQLFVGS